MNSIHLYVELNEGDGYKSDHNHYGHGAIVVVGHKN